MMDLLASQTLSMVLTPTSGATTTVMVFSFLQAQVVELSTSLMVLLVASPVLVVALLVIRASSFAAVSISVPKGTVRTVLSAFRV